MTVEMTENDTGKEFDKLVCESCGEKFSCGARVGHCWCFTVELNAETRANLRANFQKCLCGDCLKAAKFTDDLEQVG